MIVVADTSPLNYLVQLNVAHLLPVLYGRIIIPPEVASELKSKAAPPPVQEWARAMPSWLEVEAAAHIDESLRLDLGEAAAISLAQQLKADRLLIDERKGREVAAQLGIAVVGTLAVLKDAALADLLNLQEAIGGLRKTSFRASATLYERILADYYDRARANGGGEPDGK